MLANFKPTSATLLLWYWANYNCLKWPNIEQIIFPSGLTDSEQVLDAKCLEHRQARWFWLARLRVYNWNSRPVLIGHRYPIFLYIKYLDKILNENCPHIMYKYLDSQEYFQKVEQDRIRTANRWFGVPLF